MHRRQLDGLLANGQFAAAIAPGRPLRRGREEDERKFFPSLSNARLFTLSPIRGKTVGSKSGKRIPSLVLIDVKVLLILHLSSMASLFISILMGSN